MVVSSGRVDRKPLENRVIQIGELDQRHVGGDVEKMFENGSEHHCRKNRHDDADQRQAAVDPDGTHRELEADEVPQGDDYRLDKNHGRNRLEKVPPVTDIPRGEPRDDTA